MNKPLHRFLLLSLTLCNFRIPPAAYHASIPTLGKCFRCVFSEAVAEIVLIPSPLKTFGYTGDPQLRWGTPFPSVKRTLPRSTTAVH